MRILLYVMLGFMMIGQVTFAQTPVENVIFEYDDVQGARDFIAQGGPRLMIAKKFLKTTNLASLAPYADEIYVLKMGNASQQDKSDFLKNLQDAFKSYEYQGIHPSKNGEVEVYVNRGGDGYISELIVYNPELYTLNVLRGSFPVDDLLKIE